MKLQDPANRTVLKIVQFLQLNSQRPSASRPATYNERQNKMVNTDHSSLIQLYRSARALQSWGILGKNS
ncbi:hypothetical protein Q6272_31470, partial [Klebsiella pneumoniae]|uniref:hypothetical protein n=1 Tax=Klebsiella pneumoniae TaxID=573 RepID=UPI00272EF85E